MASITEQEDITLKNMACELLQQALILVERLTDVQYTKSSTVMPGGTIGKHLRHANDHFHLLYKKYTGANWIVDYDIRSRDNPSEVDRSVMMGDLEELQKIMRQCTIPIDTDITLLAAIDPSDPNKYSFKSSYGRELFYSCIHAIHHYASIKAICIEQGISISDKFGVAPSTLQYNNKIRQQQQQRSSELAKNCVVVDDSK